MRAIHGVRDALGMQTHQLEYVVVIVVLLLVRFMTGGFSLPQTQGALELASLWHDAGLRTWLADWVALFGVYFSFAHASVADRLAEVEGDRATAGQAPIIECYGKLHTSFLKREVAWFLTFFLLHAWSALAGVFIFLAYPVWRRAWRRHYPRMAKPARKPVEAR
jgi:hypothetical protein